MKVSRWVSRSWVTPTVAALFVVMAVTGVAMFFHVSTPLGVGVHEWLGWVFVVGIGAHIITNWQTARAHASHKRNQIALGLAVVVTGVILSPLFATDVSPRRAMRGALAAITAAPLRELGPITGRDTDAIVQSLRDAGYTEASAEHTIDQLVGDDRDARLRVVQDLFPMPE